MAFTLNYSHPMQRLVTEGPDTKLPSPAVGFFKQGSGFGSRHPMKCTDNTETPGTSSEPLKDRALKGKVVF